MARRPSSRRWLAEHFSDEYVRQARQLGYRSRAVFKLQELDQRHRLFKPGMSVIDLGAAPGGWSQYAAERIRPGGRIIAVDLLPMEALPGVTFIQGDFREIPVLQQLLDAVGGRAVDLVLSDLAPNMSGTRLTDMARSMHVAELAVDAARELLGKGGGLVVKVFHGPGFDDLVKAVRAEFSQVAIRKPKASRDRSPENYLVATRFLGGDV